MPHHLHIWPSFVLQMYDPQYSQFISVLGTLSQLVVLSLVIERALAFLFEWDVYVRLFYMQVPDPLHPGQTTKESRFPGLNGFIALVSAIGLCHFYKFDVLGVMFATSPNGIGMTITGLIAAGGSAGAIALFQGYLNLSKESRDANIEAKKAVADASKQQAEIALQRLAVEKAELDAQKKRLDAELEQELTKRKQAVIQKLGTQTEPPKLEAFAKEAGIAPPSGTTPSVAVWIAHLQNEVLKFKTEPDVTKAETSAAKHL